MSAMDHSQPIQLASKSGNAHYAPLASQHAERLLAHSRLCRQIARECWDKETAAELEKLAEECDRAAEQVPATDQSGTLH